jgi:hypothetical protein
MVHFTFLVEKSDSPALLMGVVAWFVGTHDTAKEGLTSINVNDKHHADGMNELAPST